MTGDPLQLDVFDILGRSADRHAPRPRAPIAPRPLTDRQAAALDIITRAGADGITAIELGERVHAHRARHALGDVCQWCAVEGNELGRALRARELVYHAGRDHWTLEQYRGNARPAAPLARHGLAPRPPGEAAARASADHTGPHTSATGTNEKGGPRYDPRTSPWPDGF